MVFVRPTRENITLLKKELKTPRFQSYSICGFELEERECPRDIWHMGGTWEAHGCDSVRAGGGVHLVGLRTLRHGRNSVQIERFM